jgi:DNA polymerase-3 subunit delta'
VLVGHQEQRAAFEAAWRSGTPHHAWLLTGPTGIGKRTFATAAAKMVLSGSQDFAGADGSEASAKVDSDAHPDLRTLVKTINEKTGKLRTEIIVDDTRKAVKVLSSHASLSDWRVILVDSACEMNRNAANALLKNLEEPPRKTIFFLVCHNPGKLLPTIRSRCRALAFKALSDDDVAAVLARHLDEPVEPELLRAARGSPGRALRYHGLEVPDMMLSINAMRVAKGQGAAQLAGSLSAKLGQKGAHERYEAFLELVPSILADAAKRGPPDGLEGAIALWEEARDLAGSAPARALDPTATAYQLARLVSRARL